jgi:hypothetical protein
MADILFFGINRLAFHAGLREFGEFENVLELTFPFSSGPESFSLTL